MKSLRTTAERAIVFHPMTAADKMIDSETSKEVMMFDFFTRISLYARRVSTDLCKTHFFSIIITIMLCILHETLVLHTTCFLFYWNRKINMTMTLANIIVVKAAVVAEKKKRVGKGKSSRCGNAGVITTELQ